MSLVFPLVLWLAAVIPPPDTLARIVPQPLVEVSTTRAGERAATAVSRLRRESIQRLDWGQDTPMALATLPGAFAWSDAGNGIGYSYLSLRGFPQRRIGVTINGVPLNDPESHEVYWIDHPDLLSSTSELQVSRGAGSALVGSAALGGTVNLETSPFSSAPRMSVTAGAGGWGTRRLVAEGASGPLEGGWDLYARYARVESDGYREQSWSRLWSYALAARRSMGRHALRVNLYGGPEETHLSYLALAPDVLAGGLTGDADRDRRSNPLSWDGERDRFFEPHAELIHTWSPREGLTVSQTAFWFDGRGHYDERREGHALADYRLPDVLTTDSTLAPRDYYAQDGTGALVSDAQGRWRIERFDLTRRREVVNRHFGWLPRVRLEHARGALVTGGELRFHDGRHIGTLLSGTTLPAGTPATPSYYDYHPRTIAASLFLREEFDLAPTWRASADLAWRHAGYAMRGDRFDGIRFDQRYDFLSPRIGLHWRPTSAWQAFASWAAASREPAFRDLHDAEGVGSRPLYRVVDIAAGIYRDPLIRPEHVQDLELGASWRTEDAALALNLYRMDLRDELVFAGQFDTDLGYAILGNAARSVHQGIELEARLLRTLPRGARLELDGNASLGDHHFIEYRERYGPTPAEEVSYDGQPLALVPATLANAGARLSWRAASLRLEAQHAGRVYADNTGRESASFPARTVWNGALTVSGRVLGNTASATLRGFNLADRRHVTTGYMDYDRTGTLVPHGMPAATRSWLAEVRLDW